MCGIAGILSLDGAPIERRSLEAMSTILRHRGPDDEGILIDGPVGLMHRRLSIIDLSPAGRCPMPNEDETVWIIFNGEIYNYLELIPGLIQRGHRFRSHCDTEVILHAYEEYGERCLDYLNGMFAFALWDSREHKLFCARDRAGIKPFYYYQDGHRFIFASEIKAIVADPSVPRRVNHQAAYDFLVNSYIDHTPATFFQGIVQLPPAHYLTVQDRRLRLQRYWDIDPGKAADPLRPSTPADDRRWATDFLVLFRDAVRLHLRSDVPVGTCLSGGLDSSAIVCMANELLWGEDQGGAFAWHERGTQQHTFSACYEEEAYDERRFIMPVV